MLNLSPTSAHSRGPKMKRLRRMRATRHASKLTVTSGVAASRKVSSEPHVTLFTVHGFTRIG